MGWNTWDLGIKDPDITAIKDEIKEEKKEESKIRAKEKKEQKKKEQEIICPQWLCVKKHSFMLSLYAMHVAHSPLPPTSTIQCTWLMIPLGIL